MRTAASRTSRSHVPRGRTRDRSRLQGTRSAVSVNAGAWGRRPAPAFAHRQRCVPRRRKHQQTHKRPWTVQKRTPQRCYYRPRREANRRLRQTFRTDRASLRVPTSRFRDRLPLGMTWRAGGCGTIAPVHPFLVSAAIVAIAEFGDKTQLLALVLAARFRKPGVILLGILCATVVNHLIAGAVGAWIASEVRPSVLRLIVGAAFLVMAVWTLLPERREEGDDPVRPRFGVFGTTLIAFFLAEMGDKTQIATATLAARYQTLVPVVAGSVLGMLAMDALAILIGEVAAHRLPLKLIRAVAAAIFLLLAGLVLTRTG